MGGGPGGMMAAGRAAERGLTVLLLEKNAELGKKLLIRGGRCNVTNAEFDNRKLLAKFKGNGKYLFRLSRSGACGRRFDFFDARSTPTKVEALQRVFPLRKDRNPCGMHWSRT